MVRVSLGYRLSHLVVLPFLCLSLAASETSESSDAGSRWVSAYSAMESGHRHWLADDYGDAAAGYRRAISGFEGILRDHPSWRTDLVLFRLAYCRVKLGECESQLSSFEREDDVGALRELLRRERERNGRLSVELERLGASGASSLARARGELDRLRGTCETLSGKYVRQTHELAVSRESLARSEGELRRLREAKGAFAEVLSERDDLRERLGVLERKLERERRRAGARAVSESLRWRDRALASESRGDGASAARYWQLCGESGGDPVECWTRSSYFYWQVGEHEKSREGLSRLFASLSAAGRYWGMLSRICLSLDEGERSLGLSAMSVALKGDGPDQLVSLGASLMGLGEKVLSERVLRRALAVAPREGEALRCMAALLSSLGPSRKTEARGFYERALQAGMPHEPGLDAYFGMSIKERSGK